MKHKSTITCAEYEHAKKTINDGGKITAPTLQELQQLKNDFIKKFNYHYRKPSKNFDIDFLRYINNLIEEVDVLIKKAIKNGITEA